MEAAYRRGGGDAAACRFVGGAVSKLGWTNTFAAPAKMAHTGAMKKHDHGANKQTQQGQCQGLDGMAGQPMLIGISARIYHPLPGATGLSSKRMQYLEASIAQWVLGRNALVFMIPTVDTGGQLHPSNITLRHYARQLDGLVLQGGADIAPETYGQTARRPEWCGDRARDLYELALLHEFIDAGKPVLGICRGCQLINVAFGGTLHQDVASEVPAAIGHFSDSYDRHFHAIDFNPEGSLAHWLAQQPERLVNSIHHQAIEQLGTDIEVEARAREDGMIEAIRYRPAPFVLGLQWHPEFHHATGDELLDCTPVLDAFLRAAALAREPTGIASGSAPVTSHQSSI
jgi:putative glutamine amidotransferase